jgi:hypothetical protein
MEHPISEHRHFIKGPDFGLKSFFINFRTQLVSHFIHFKLSLLLALHFFMEGPAAASLHLSPQSQKFTSIL